MNAWTSCRCFIAALLVGILTSASVHAEELAPIDLNEATLQDLQKLPGVGPKRAEAILELRRKRPFTRVSQLLDVKGIGPKSLEKLKARVKVGALPGPSTAALRRDGASAQRVP